MSEIRCQHAKLNMKQPMRNQKVSGFLVFATLRNKLTKNGRNKNDTYNKQSEKCI